MYLETSTSARVREAVTKWEKKKKKEGQSAKWKTEK